MFGRIVRLVMLTALFTILFFIAMCIAGCKDCRHSTTVIQDPPVEEIFPIIFCEEWCHGVLITIDVGTSPVVTVECDTADFEIVVTTSQAIEVSPLPQGNHLFKLIDQDGTVRAFCTVEVKKEHHNHGKHLGQCK